MLYYRKYFIVILALICVLLAMFGVSLSTPEESPESVAPYDISEKVEIVSPTINWVRTANLEKNWVFVEVYNPNSASADVMLDVYFYQSGIMIGEAEHLYYVSLGPGQIGLLFYGEDIPANYDYLDTEIIFFMQSAFEYKEPKLKSEERLESGLILDYDFASENGSTVAVLCFNNEGIVGFSYFVNLRILGSKQFYSCAQSFNKYKIYENFY